jgi:hypothetical protein
MCERLIEELRPLASSCGVNGAVVAFSGSHAHFAGLAAGALGRIDEAGGYLGKAVEVHQRLGATVWEANSRSALQSVCGSRPILRRRGKSWEISYQTEVATVPDTKGIRDLAVLLSRRGVDVHVLELAGSPVPGGVSIEMVDRAALDQYRRRLVDLDDDLAEAERNNDTERAARAEAERQALLDELRVVRGLGGQSRLTGANATERARKAVSARIRDAIRHLEHPAPQLAAHLDHAIVTGAWCRYRGDESEPWTVEA